LLAGCVLAHGAASQRPTGKAQDAHGYALLYDLLGDEKDVAKLRFIKHQRPELKQLVKEISARCGEAHKRLEAFAKADTSLNLKDLGLPADEVAARKAISKYKEKALLTEQGKEFEVQLLLSQNEALTYGAHLAQILAPVESQPERAQYLSKLSFDLLQLQQKILGMLLANYRWPGQ
jgi:hypothetical protein